MAARSKLNLVGCTNPEVMEKIDKKALYCKLCVNYFKRHQRLRSEKTQKQWVWTQKRKSLVGDGSASPSAKKGKKEKENAVVPYQQVEDVDDE